MPGTVTIGGIVLSATSVSDSGAWNSPSKRTEEGFEYSTYVRTQPLSASIEAWVPVEEYSKLQRLREGGKPFEASIGTVSVSKAKLDDLERQDEQDVSSHYKVSISITEVHEATVETAEISIETEGGASLGTAAGETPSSTAQPENSDGGQTEEETGGIAGSLSGIRESLSGVF
ncbi:hypothetical protein SAMN05192561_11274 [Halopenitus malekzadehii]|uniref:Uncharacterized protein n=1 Tax=Halopenitus malekzadehii TaxID=1267564 RepID=A0A1H6JPA5_9EURY|nr:hypothetical protein [Halopenitus malekzadehii]SEH61133.1 hypothetical protein SAMN05192561_11274 [Halopenitus malekzadehii]